MSVNTERNRTVTESTANQAMADKAAAEAAERARWAAKLAAPSRAAQHYKPAPSKSRASVWAQVAVSLTLFAGVGVLLALGV